MATHLLPCPCGKTIPIEPRHAGQEVRCDCGATVRAPSLLQISALPQASTSAGHVADTARPWGLYQAIVFGGMCLLVVATLGMIANAMNPPVSPREGMTPTLMRKRADDMSPRKTLEVFWHMKEIGLEDPKSPADRRYETQLMQYRAWYVITAIVALGSMAAVAVGVWQMMQGRRQASGVRS